MTRCIRTIGAGLWLGGAAILAASPSVALDLALPRGARETLAEQAELTRHPVPIGAFSEGVVPSQVVEGTLQRRVWQIPDSGTGTARLFNALLEQLAEQGFEQGFTCVDVTCGGFDFRFGIQVAQAPEMFVNLSDFRFASRIKDAETALSLLVSTAGQVTYVQLVQISPDVASVATEQNTLTVPLTGAPGEVGATLEQNGSAVLDDLEFATGASELTDQDFASLGALAAWLNATPSARVYLVGHTDAEGSLDGNITLSRRRAEAVAQRLQSRHGVDAAQVSAQGMGFLAPRASNLTEAGRQLNRRVEVVLITR